MRPRVIFSHITCVHSYHVGLLRPSRLQICLWCTNNASGFGPIPPSIIGTTTLAPNYMTEMSWYQKEDNYLQPVLEQLLKENQPNHGDYQDESPATRCLLNYGSAPSYQWASVLSVTHKRYSQIQVTLTQKAWKCWRNCTVASLVDT